MAIDNQSLEKIDQLIKEASNILANPVLQKEQILKLQSRIQNLMLSSDEKVRFFKRLQ